MTSGASNDIERATDLARKMVAMFGMSDKFGVMGLATVQNQYLDGGYGLNCAQDTAALIDQEVQAILEQCHREARQILADNRDQLDAVAGYLLKKETITGGEMMAILEGKDPALADNFGDNTEKAALSGDIEPPARHIHIVSEPPAVPGEEQEAEAPQTDDDTQPL